MKQWEWLWVRLWVLRHFPKNADGVDLCWLTDNSEQMVYKKGKSCSVKVVVMQCEMRFLNKKSIVYQMYIANANHL